MGRWVAVVVASVLAVALSASPVQARHLSVTDAGRDTWRTGLDITGVQIGNNDQAVVAQVRLANAVRGRVIVSVEARRGSGLRLLHLHRPGRRDRTAVMRGPLMLLPQSACPRASGTWHARTRSVTLRLPSRCLDAGQYGAVRISVLTERPRGADVDAAPQKSNRQPTVTRWIRRR